MGGGGSGFLLWLLGAPACEEGGGPLVNVTNGVCPLASAMECMGAGESGFLGWMEIKVGSKLPCVCAPLLPQDSCAPQRQQTRSLPNLLKAHPGVHAPHAETHSTSQLRPPIPQTPTSVPTYSPTHPPTHPPHTHTTPSTQYMISRGAKVTINTVAKAAYAYLGTQ